MHEGEASLTFFLRQAILKDFVGSGVPGGAWTDPRTVGVSIECAAEVCARSVAEVYTVSQRCMEGLRLSRRVRSFETVDCVSSFSKRLVDSHLRVHLCSSPIHEGSSSKSNLCPLGRLPLILLMM